MQLHLHIQAPAEEDASIYDALIIGGGPAGVSAAIYLKRKGHAVTLVSSEPGGQVATTASVENYPGFRSISGYDLAQSYLQHLQSLSVNVLAAKVTEITKPDLFHVVLDSGQVLKSHTLLLATGATRRKLGVKGESRLAGRGVAYCSICDGPFFADKDVLVVGGGNSAVETAIDLAKIARKVTLVHRSTLKADQVAIDQLHKYDNITILLSHVIDEIRGEHVVEQVLLRDTLQGNLAEMPADGVFIDIGSLPSSELAAPLLVLNERGEIPVQADGSTALEGFHSAGDVTDEKYKQIVVAAGRGASAALAMSEYLNKRK